MRGEDLIPLSLLNRVLAKGEDEEGSKDLPILLVAVPEANQTNSAILLVVATLDVSGWEESGSVGQIMVEEIHQMALTPSKLHLIKVCSSLLLFSIF